MQRRLQVDDGEGPVGGYETQIYNDVWDQENQASGDEDVLTKVDRALAMEVNIPLDHKGELVSFREVRNWESPSISDLTHLRNRINDEWIKPLNLKQQDIVRATGLGAPYVCYLLKDPNSPNMNRRRKIETYSVLTELFRKFDAKIIKKEDFVKLRNQRVANRFQGPRQDRTGRMTGNIKNQQRRRRRRTPPYNDEYADDDEKSTIDEDMNDTSRSKRKRKIDYGNISNYGSYDMSMYMNQNKQYIYPNVMPNSCNLPQSVPQGPQQSMPWMPNTNFPQWYSNEYYNKLGRGQRMSAQQDISELMRGKPFPAYYSSGFPVVMRTIFSLSNVIDGPPPISSEMTARNANSDSKETEYDVWIKSKVSQLNKQCYIPSFGQNETVLWDSSTYAFVFLIDRNSCLLPIGVKFDFDKESLNVNIKENIWDINHLRYIAEKENWLSENRDWDNSIWVLWDLSETTGSVNSLFHRWQREKRLSDAELHNLIKSFLSQYVYLRDIELAFKALLPQATPNEVFTRTVEINCDLLEERVKVKDLFVWDLRSSDWELAALLSNFVSDFNLDAPAISSLLIDLKTTILRYKKEWVQATLERLTMEGKIQPTKVVPETLGLVA